MRGSARIVGAGQVKANIAAIAGKADVRPILPTVRTLGVRGIQRNFLRQSSPEGVPWKVTRRGGTILRDTSRLYNSFSGTVLPPARVEWHTDVEYAAAQHFGAKTKPHRIEPRDPDGVLAWITADGQQRFAKFVNHPGSTIDARPFMGLSQLDRQIIEQTVTRFLRGRLGA